ncbi:MAG: ABC transporter ATP-binding protein [Solirubrobacteraceae bacterium]|nr:ABC transporter ATP-binding protein [Solirubrobacteraceae bacterium]
MSAPPELLLEVCDLSVSFATEGGLVEAVDEVSFTLRAGEVLAVVGESGAGKSVTAMTLMGLTRSPNARFGGTARLRDLELLGASDEQLRAVRGEQIAMVFQDPMSALNPVQRIGGQIVEQIRAHRDVSRGEARERVVALLERVGIARARERLDAYPHELSGGMRQRALIAMALSCDPAVLIADEPTTALDVTIQAQILALLEDLRTASDAGIVLVTHDLGVVAEIADRIAVMYAGRIVEQGSVDEIFHDPQHPYTWGLLGSIARIDRPQRKRLPSIPGLPPSLVAPPDGCHFRPRCPHAHDACLTTPELRARAAGGAPGREDRCVLSPERKLALREIGGRIGLQSVERDGASATAAGNRRPASASVPAPGDRRSSPGRAPAARPAPDDEEILLAVEHLEQHFPVRRGVLSAHRETARVRAVDDVTLQLRQGETLGLVGESGCGKTTLARTLMRLLDPTAGTISFRGTDVTRAGRAQLKPFRRELQMVFQDPFASLNPRKRIGQIVGAPLALHGAGRAEVAARAAELLERVGLQREHLDRFPHEFSGGQRQRIGIARALAMEPKLIVLDEPVSALDVSIRAQIVNLLGDLQDDFGLAYLFVAHDLAVVRHVADRIAVMYLGQIIELSPAEELYVKPIHPYTSALLSAIPVPDPRESRARERVVLDGEPPSAIDPPAGCVFHTRCPRAQEVCRRDMPRLSEYPGGHLAACHFPLHVSAAEAAASTRSPASPLAASDTPPQVPSEKTASAAPQ